VNSGRRLARPALIALCASVTWQSTTAAALARTDAIASSATVNVPTASSGPPLSTGNLSPGGAGATEGSDPESSPQAEADPLVSNGLGSPLCKGVLGSGELPPNGMRNCETSGFVASAAPTGNYGIDVHIDTGLLGVSPSSIEQDMIVMPLWMAIVWMVHAVVVMLEWCFTIDVLGSTTADVGVGLRQAQATLTQPWLVIVLSVASVLALYNGLVRRRVADTLGQAMLMTAMMVAGLWVIADPTGTVDALGGWANQASLGTLAVAARGTPASAGGALARSMDTVFAAAIEAPWCYLEFGDVDWCRNPSRLEPTLRTAAAKIAAGELALIGCGFDINDLLRPCAAKGSAQAKALEHSAALLREARSNGAIFLALPANGPARNAINEPGSLLRSLCESSEMNSCHGPTAAQAEFRTGSGTLARLGGLLLIAAGVLGMVLLLGFIALRLLAAAIFSLLYLLLTPGMVLAPALGDGGRTVFRRWAAQLLGAVVSKLLFSFLLGVVLAVLAILSELQTLGWWTQWLLMSAFWWGAFVRRHQALGLAEGAFGRESGGSRTPAGASRSIARRVSNVLDTPRKAIGAARWTMNKLGGQAPSVEQRRGRAQAASQRARAGADEQVRRTLEREHGDALARMHGAPQAQQRMSDKRAQLQRVQQARAGALARGDTRRAAELGHRGQRIEGEIAHEQTQLGSARKTADEGERAMRRTGDPFSREQLQERERFLDAQARLPPARGRSGVGEPAERRRDYAALAALAGYGPSEYEQLDPRARRAARLEIDRELGLRRELAETARSVAADGGAAKLGRRDTHKADRAFDKTLAQRMRDEGRRMPRSRVERTAVDRWRAAGRAERSRGAGRPERESSVMRDAREVAARRKRQLGTDRD
jgi:hypothetical protein